ncbi:NAD(P)-binding Rossmann-fold superfamily protein [Abeliophyllum distichum]|uniref:Dihydroflavonol 4-reductase n=1 Tax=Abeliophyllum distichum TaxID=126358 RepID=A0ABD1QJ01_9LAMI
MFNIIATYVSTIICSYYPEKAFQLLNQWESKDQLRLFRADLQEDGSFDEAVRGCDGVFHVAASMEFGVLAAESVDCNVQRNIIDPAIRGTLNVLKSCSKTSSVRRVVFTSSISTMTSKDNFGRWIPIVDESCQIPVQRVLETKSSGWVYVLSKLLTEEAAFQFARENGIHLISVITTTVAGPFLTPTVPVSIRVLLSPITGDPNLLPILAAVNSRMGSIALVHIEDICNAHIFLMEHAKAEGRYICCTGSCFMSELVEHLSKEYPCPIIQRVDREEHDSVLSEISSKKITDLGFAYKYGIQDIIHETIGSVLVMILHEKFFLYSISKNFEILFLSHVAWSSPRGALRGPKNKVPGKSRFEEVRKRRVGGRGGSFKPMRFGKRRSNADLDCVSRKHHLTRKSDLEIDGKLANTACHNHSFLISMRLKETPSLTTDVTPR